MVTPKEPWMMTREEYRESLDNAAYEYRMEPSAPGSPPNRIPYSRLKVGDEGVFYRSGELPKSGRSRNAISGQIEEGVSVYSTPYATSLAGLSGRQWYRGKGKVIAFGSDGEPLITPTGKWQTVGKKGYEPLGFLHESQVQKALSEGKPVPPEVLKDYPDLAKPSGVTPEIPKVSETPKVEAEQGGQPESRSPHKAEVAGPTPAPATKTKKHRVLKSDVLKRQAGRSPRARALDSHLSAPITAPPRYPVWIKDPAHYDVKNVDTKVENITSRKPALSHHPTRITPRRPRLR